MTGQTAARQLRVSMSEIAELAGVRRPVVTNWRRRHAAFPTPVASEEGRSLFDARSVLDWLADTGRAERSELEAALALHALGTFRVVPARQLAATVTALICLRQLDGEPLASQDGETGVVARLRRRAALTDPDDHFVLSEIKALSGDAGWLADVVDDLIEASWDCQRAFERVLSARDRLGVAGLYQDAVRPELARLAAGLCGVRERSQLTGAVRIADPAAGAGDLLVSVLGQLAEDVAPVVSGAEADPFLARITRRRLIVHGISWSDVKIDAGDRLGGSGATLDAVVTCLPYAPKEHRPLADGLAKVRQIADGLAVGSTAVVIGAAGVLVDALPSSHATAVTRKELLASGVVEAVVHLPGGMMPFRPGYQTALCVLRREDPSPWRGRVLFADVSERELTSALVDDLVTDVATWRRAGYRPNDHARSVAEQVDIARFLAPGSRLTARRRPGLRDATVGANEAVARASEMERELEGLRSLSRASVRSGVAAGERPVPVPTVRLGELVRAGWLRALSGIHLDADDVIPAGSHAVLGAPEVTGAVPVGHRTVDRLAFAARHPKAVLTEPGDVVVTMSPMWGAYIDHGGFSVVEFPARALRIRPGGDRQLTPRVLAALLAGSRTGARAPGAVRAGRLDDLEIPRLAAHFAERLDGLLALAEDRRRLAEREIETIDALCRTVVAGLIDGTLTLS